MSPNKGETAVCGSTIFWQSLVPGSIGWSHSRLLNTVYSEAGWFGVMIPAISQTIDRTVFCCLVQCTCKKLHCTPLESVLIILNSCCSLSCVLTVPAEPLAETFQNMLYSSVRATALPMFTHSAHRPIIPPPHSAHYHTSVCSLIHVYLIITHTNHHHQQSTQHHQ